MVSRIIIVGAGEAGRMLARDIAGQSPPQYKVVGFIDDADSLGGTTIEGAPVLGATDALSDVVRDQNIDEVIIAVPSAGREFVRRLVTLCRDARVPYRLIPGLLEIIKGPVHLEQIRDVRPEDLLGRESVEFDEEKIADSLDGSTVLVTGGGGSIGGEIARQIGRFGLRRLVLLGRGENQIYDVEQELRRQYPRLDVATVIADIRDRAALERAFVHHRPRFVYHAAAHKHVHYMEAFPDEAVKNNVIGTANVIEAAKVADVERVVMLSTDKAVNPRGVMGATKRLAEYLMLACNRPGNTPRLITVRFGNVLASRGSVVPLFIRQIRGGGPVTVSDEEATRFFMSIKEACMLVVQASLTGEGGEIFILRMGEPIRIVELARDLISLYGFRPDEDIAIEITGLRPGEKLHESLLAEGEHAEKSSHPYILKSSATVPDGVDIAAVVRELAELADAGDVTEIRRILSRVIPDAALLTSRIQH